MLAAGEHRDVNNQAAEAEFEIQLALGVQLTPDASWFVP
jgi:hypothetical protein